MLIPSDFRITLIVLTNVIAMFVISDKSYDLSWLEHLTLVGLTVKDLVFVLEDSFEFILMSVEDVDIPKSSSHVIAT